ncbi:MAG: gamma-glutamylcyclotransferase [Chloroflexi bacterium]|nr:gamma-glutamylcyclotransferase [Chloroflexota bacterium]
MYYFAYGSNLSRRQMSECCPDAKPRFTAILPNYKVVFTDWSRKWRGGTATIRVAPKTKVKGAVYEISARDLAALDKHEGYPDTYDRINVKVITEDDEFIDAVTYIKSKQSEETTPSPDYVAIMRQGYKDWRLA